jgi:hypothetical protein
MHLLLKHQSEVLLCYWMCMFYFVMTDKSEFFSVLVIIEIIVLILRSYANLIPKLLCTCPSSRPVCSFTAWTQLNSATYAISGAMDLAMQ